MTDAVGKDAVVGEGIALRYACELSALPPRLAARFHPSGHDADGAAFVERSLAAPHGALQTRLYAVLRRALSDYDAYGLLGMYPMHLWSTAQLAALLAAAGTSPRGRLLDVGAGSGDITARSAPGFDQVKVTETSAVLRRRLRRRGFEVLDLDLGEQPPPPELRADVVTCLNVLDRTAYPRTLLAHLRAALAPNGRLVLSLPLPLRPHVQRSGHTADPEEPLPVGDATFEASLARVHDELLVPAGLYVLAWTRLPYLSHGDATRLLYGLDAAVLACGRGRDEE